MLNIYAHRFMTASRVNTVKARGITKPEIKTKKRWLPKGHWWLSAPKDLDLGKL